MRMDALMAWIRGKPWLTAGFLVLVIVAVSSLAGLKADTGTLRFMAEATATGTPAAGSPATGSPATGREETQSAEAREPDPMIRVYVVGAVRMPGLVTLPRGSLVMDAIEKAGGFTEDADMTSVNGAYPLSENVMVRVAALPATGGSEEGEPGMVSATAAGVFADAAIINEDADGDGLIAVNINTAGLTELERIPGVGEQTARDILTYREKYGRFERIEDIMKVSGIKEGRFERMKDVIRVTP